MKAPNDAAVRPRYVVDPKLSRFTVQAFSGGMLSALGHDPTFVARDFDGHVSFDPDAPNDATLAMTMRSASIELVDDVSERDRVTILRTMHDEVLESATYPEIAYRCPKASTRGPDATEREVLLDGDLTLHGATHHQPISAKLSATGPTLRAVGEFAVRQSDYGIKQVKIAGSMLKVKDELRCSFDIVARRGPE